ncbi:MAG: DsbA family oxidoreductase [Gammaproteobacteria bacterium]|nr:DsbA family oxidoreductase [Gammaproteobacteria bacterium]
MLIEIFSDIVCPWCYIGKRNLDIALDSPAGEGVELIWRPYQLYPNVPPGGIDRLAFLRARFGEASNPDYVPEPIGIEADAVGLRFDFAAMKTTPNTFQAHRLMDFAHQSKHQHALAEVLFRYYFCEGKNVGDLEVLRGAAGEVGLDRAAVVEYLESGAGSEEVRRQLARAQGAGVTGVPCYLLEETFAIPGAQSPDVLVQLISRAKERLATA